MGELVYVRDADYEWLPATVLETTTDDEDRVLVRLNIPTEFCRVTLVKGSGFPQDGDTRWVELREYHNSVLPCREEGDGSLHDFSTLTHINEAAALYRVKELIRINHPFIRCDNSIMLAIDPAKHREMFTPEYQALYTESQTSVVVKEEKKESEQTDTKPHIYEVSNRAKQDLVDNSRNQAIFVVGETATGKSETARALVNHLLSHSAPEDLQRQLHHASLILEAFGNAKTEGNISSTRFGQVCQLEYEPNGSLVGAIYKTHMMEATRVANPQQANFHIFYQMLNAAPSVKAQILGADWEQALPADFAYLTEPDENPGDWEETAEALAFFGWQGLPLQRLVQALSVTLLLGNVEFGENDGCAVVESLADLNMVALSLGISASVIEAAVTHRAIVDKNGAEITLPYDIDQAKRACGSLAQVLYDCIFASVVRQINILTAAPPAVTGRRHSISLVDMFGFENHSANSLETLCVNYANEKVHQRYIADNFRHGEFGEDDVEIPELKSVSNLGSLRLIDGASGIIKTLRDECGRANATNENFVCKLKLANKSNKSFVNEKTGTSFGIRHFAGTVTYDSHNFVRTAIEKIPEHLLKIVAKSTNGVLSYEISELMKESSVTRRKRSKSMFDTFRRQLKSLLSSVEGSQSHFIRCLKSIDNAAIKLVDHSSIARQLHYAGVVRKIELTRPLFTRTSSFSDIEHSFIALVPADKVLIITDLSLPDKIQLMLSILFAPTIGKFRSSTFDMPFVCGRSKAYFRHGSLETLEERLDRSVLALKTVLRWWRTYRLALNARRELKAGQFIARWLKMQVVLRQYTRMKDAGRLLTFWSRGRIDRSKFNLQRRAAKVIRTWYKRQACKSACKRIRRIEETAVCPDLLDRSPECTLTDYRELLLDTVVPISEGHIPAPCGEIDWSCFDEDLDSTDNSESCVLVHKEVLHETEQLKKKVVDLKDNIVQVTTEAELHNQEIAADFEDRLVEYEQEVLQLKERIVEFETEKITWEKEIAANVENIKSLKDGIRTMQETHRDYLTRVTRAIEKANTEHAKSLRSLERDRETTVRQLKTELRMLKKRQQVYDMTPLQRSAHFHSLARKLEKITSPSYIAEKVQDCCEKVSMEDNIEEHVSSKTRNILYRLEDLAAASSVERFSDVGSCGAQRTETLQRRLVASYEEIEDLKLQSKQQQRIRSKTRNRNGISRLFVTD